MKINKTEREFREAINRGRVGLRVPVDDTVPFADALKAALDLEFKPEKPELPRRITAGFTWHKGMKLYEPREGDRGTNNIALEEGRIYREAAARYNAMERLVDDRNFPAGLTPATVRRTLEDEREKLQ